MGSSSSVLSTNPPLIEAAKKGDVALVSQILEQGADINQTDEYGWNALRIAALNGHEAIVKHLVEKGADIHLKMLVAKPPKRRLNRLDTMVLQTFFRISSHSIVG